MKIDTTSKQNVEKKDNSVQMQNGDESVLTAVNVPFSDLLAQKLNDNEIGSDAAGSISSFIDCYNYDSMSMDFEDAVFFVNLTKEGHFSIENAPNGDFKSIVKLETAQNVVTQKTVEVTNHLTSLIEKAQKTQKPVRISFDNDVSVVLKIDKHGKVTAEFIPGNSEVENYLRNNIASLKQRFDEQNLPYNDLFYRQNGKQNKNKNQKDNKGDQ